MTLENSNEVSDRAAAAVAKTDNRVTLAQMQAKIAGVKYLYDETLTICVITLHSGWKLVDVSACIDPANYNKTLGEKIAYERAEKQLWQLEGYLRAHSPEVQLG